MREVDPTCALVPSSIYRWIYPKAKGCGGVIPAQSWGLLKKCAAIDGVILDERDLYPYPVESSKWDFEEYINDRPIDDEDPLSGKKRDRSREKW